MKYILSLLIFLNIYSLPALSFTMREFKEMEMSEKESNVTRIDNISFPEELEGSNTVIIGHRYWQIMNRERTIFPLPKQLNELIRCYHYKSNSYDKEYQGEVYLNIYDLEKNGKDDREQLYKKISYSFLNLKDSIINWKETDVFKPFPAFEYTFLGFITHEKDGSYESHNLNLKVILANDRAYVFVFCSKQLEDSYMFDESCLNLIKDVDIVSYHEKEKEREEENKLEEEKAKEKVKRSKFNLQIGSIVLSCSMFIFILASWRIRRNNKYAKRWAVYTCVLFFIDFSIMTSILVIRSSYEDTQEWLWWYYVPSTILDSTIVWYLNKCTAYEHQEYYLIPKFLLRNRFFRLSNNFKKRIFMIVLVYPFFILAPIPFVGLGFLACYIIPISIIFIATLGIINLTRWLN